MIPKMHQIFSHTRSLVSSKILQNKITHSLVAAAIYSMCQPRNVLYCKVFLWKCYVHGLGSQKMLDANLHTLGNLHNQAN